MKLTEEEARDKRLTEPEECDCCGSEVKLYRYDFYDRDDVEWLCKYCEVSFNKYDTKSMAAMFNVLEKELKKITNKEE